MSEQKKTLTLRRLEPGDTKTPGDYYAKKWDEEEYHDYCVVNPIPEGFEECDLADATKVLIGATWCDVYDRIVCGFYMSQLNGLGVLAIRPIPEPMTGEALVESMMGELGMAFVPAKLIGKHIRWEEMIKDSDG